MVPLPLGMAEDGCPSTGVLRGREQEQGSNTAQWRGLCSEKLTRKTTQGWDSTAENVQNRQIQRQKGVCGGWGEAMETLLMGLLKRRSVVPQSREAEAGALCQTSPR